MARTVTVPCRQVAAGRYDFWFCDCLCTESESRNRGTVIAGSFCTLQSPYGSLICIVALHSHDNITRHGTRKISECNECNDIISFFSFFAANYAEHWCSLLKDSEGPFARCHSTIDPSEYYKVLWSCMLFSTAFFQMGNWNIYLSSNIWDITEELAHKSWWSFCSY